MPNHYAGGSILEEIKTLVEKNSKSIEEMQKQMNFVYRYIFWQRVWKIVKIVVVIAIVIIGIVYLPPLIQKTIAPYWQLLQELGGQQKELFEKIQQLPGAGILFDQSKTINVK